MRQPLQWGSNSVPSAARQGAQPSRVLLLCDYNPYDAATVVDHVDAIRRHSKSDVFVLSIRGDLPPELDLDLFDAIVLHYSVVISLDGYLSPLARWRIRTARAVKAAFVQDEYRFVNVTIDALRALGVDVLFTCVPEDQVPLVYPQEKLPDLRRTQTVLTGYVTDRLLDLPAVSFEQRPVDVGYRARRNPFWLGSLGEEKTTIAVRFQADAAAFGLRTDISIEEADRIYGEDWVRWLSHCKAVLGVESGASVFDFDGSVELAVIDYCSTHPEAGFEEVREEVLKDLDGRIRLNQISPRCFEAAALRTLMVLYEGDYSGVLTPWRHYIPLKKDHSNTEEVVRAVRDREVWERITTAARLEVAENPRWSWAAMAAIVDEGLSLPPETTSQRPLDVERFTKMAERSFVQAMLLGRPESIARTDRRALPHRLRRITAAVLPNPVRLNAPTLAATATNTSPGIRLRRWNAAFYWLLRPHLQLRGQHVSRDVALLADLASVAALQQLGLRAQRASGSTPCRLRVDQKGARVVIALVADPEIGANPAHGRALSDLDALDWAQTIELSVQEPLFGPPWLTSGRLPALSHLLRERPDVVRRVLLQNEDWARVERESLVTADASSSSCNA